MALFTIDRERCKRDKICVGECPLGIITTDSEGYPVPVTMAEGICINCGHCVSVCPHGAMSLERMPKEQCVAIDKSLSVSEAQVEQLLKSRRSVRNYKQTPVERDVIEKLLDVTRYAPTGMNAQEVCYKVIYASASVQRVASAVIDWMRELQRQGSLVAGTYNAGPLVGAWDAGRDLICRHAPHLLITHAPKENMAAAIDCSIALTYFMVASEAHGVGTCWAGFVQLAANMSPDVLGTLGLPQGHGCFGAMMFGRPVHGYKRIPRRKPAQVIWG